MPAATTLYGQRLKPLCDMVLAAVALVLVLPVIGLIAVIVRIRIGSPVLFTQWRPGLGGRPFKLRKFRTMTKACDHTGRPLPDDQRITPLGRLLRASSLDELPELWNVLLGEMSLVGPRPLLPDYLAHYTRRQNRRHDVRPGITGWAQVTQRNWTTWRRRLAADVWYVETARRGSICRSCS